MFNSVCGEQQPHPARHEAGHGKDPGPKHPETPQGTGPPGRTTAGTTAASTQKGQRRARRRDPWQHSVRRPGCRGGKPAGSTGSRPPQGGPGPGPGDPKAPTPQSGPARPVGPGPAIDRREWGRRSPEHPAPAREITNAPAASSTGRAWWWGGGRLRWWVRRSLRPDLTHRRRRQAHIYTSICSHPHARKRIFTTFAPHVDTQKWTRYPHSHSPYALYTPRSRHHHPQRGSQRPIPELNPFAPAWGQEDHPGPRSSRENQQPRPRPGGQLILTAPGPRQRTENRGVRKKKKKKKKRTPCFTPHPLKCSVGVVLF